ncbi:outer membrane protein [Afipia sp. GAS231]|uniref:outer membrane protein n=1 Tax=Afipia sp. GAS231 TaxID=1882747 RepID=UPI00087CC91E|nr:porin family protein [Afipia sp. GAS231]SDO06540.1 outer membrane immunogenic protein [Afipia sp. GAS231]
MKMQSAPYRHGASPTTRHPGRRRLLLTGASLVVLSGSALAADLPIAKAPPPAIAASLSSWAGFYLGVHGGYGWKQDEFSQSEAFLLTRPQSINGIRSQGAVYGGQAGYNWQFGRAVTGLEIDFSATGIKGSNGITETNPFGGGTFTTAIALGERVQYLGTARARLGWLPTDNVLLYGTAGLAWERLDLTQSSSQIVTPGTTQIFSVRTPTDKFGWVAGVGAEVMLGSPNWIGRLEYLHYDLGQVQTANLTIQAGGFRDVSTAGSQTIDVVRAGVSYKFGETTRFASVPYAKAPAMAASLSSWAGFYAGAHGGYGWGENPFFVPNALTMINGGDIGGTKPAGWVAGGHFGHNWQYDRFVTGLEADLSAADLKGASNTVTSTGGGGSISLGFDDKVKYLGTVRGRLGYTVTPNFLLYGTAGLAWERFERAQVTTTTAPAGSTITRSMSPSDRFGWVAGVGGEVMLGSPNWIARLEYLHYDFGRINVDGSVFSNQPGATSAAITAGHQTIDLVRAGISYKFGPDTAPFAAASPLYAKAPRMPAPLQSWAGFYIGAHAGYGWKQNDFSTVFFLNTFDGGIHSKGWLGGGQAGYNWQYGNVVAGLELDGTATGIKGSSIPVTASTETETLSDNMKYLGTARGRLGYTVTPNWLLYGTGGLAWEHGLRKISDISVFPGVGVQTGISDTPRDLFGWVAGVGVETFIGSSNWIARLEYLHYDFGGVEATNTVVSTLAGVASTADKPGRQTIDTVRAGVSYKFTP